MMYLENNQFMDYDTRRELYHHGILGQKWGVRRYQNEDGSLTSLGRKHVNDGETPKQETHSYRTVSKGLKSAMSSNKELVKNSKQEMKQLKKDLNSGKISESKYKKRMNEIGAAARSSANNIRTESINSAKNVSIGKSVARDVAVAIAGAGALTLGAIALDKIASKTSNDGFSVAASVYRTSANQRLSAKNLIGVAAGAAASAGITKALANSKNFSHLTRTFGDTAAERKAVRISNKTQKEIKKAEKNRYRREQDLAFDRYYKAIEKVESKYKGPQRMSEEDLAKKKAIEERYNAQVEALKKKYKK